MEDGFPQNRELGLQEGGEATFLQIFHNFSHRQEATCFRKSRGDGQKVLRGYCVPRSRGSNASRNPSPRKLKANMVMANANAGKMAWLG
jgi:hypothetical protein